jgi:hypothetical protein
MAVRCAQVPARSAPAGLGIAGCAVAAWRLRRALGWEEWLTVARAWIVVPAGGAARCVAGGGLPGPELRLDLSDARRPSSESSLSIIIGLYWNRPSRL